MHSQRGSVVKQNKKKKGGGKRRETMRCDARDQNGRVVRTLGMKSRSEGTEGKERTSQLRIKR